MDVKDVVGFLFVIYCLNHEEDSATTKQKPRQTVDSILCKLVKSLAGQNLNNLI